MSGRFFPTLWTEVKARLAAQMLGFLLALLILAAQYHFGVIRSDLHGRILSIAWPYALILVAFLVFHLARTPWLISNDHLDTIRSATQAKDRLEQELSDAEATPIKLDIRPTEIYRIPAFSGRDRNVDGEMTYDIFLLARIELKEPSFVALGPYALRLLLHGTERLYGMERDVNEWELTIWSPTTPKTYPMQPLSMDVRRGIPMEGWLHFKVPKISFKTLDQSTVGLMADGGQRGIAMAEIPASPSIWNPDPNKRIGRKVYPCSR